MNESLSTLMGILAAFVVSILIGDLGIRPIRNEMYRGMEDTATQSWRPRAVGWLERFLYTATILAGFPEFVAIWLALKVAGQWERWKIDVGTPTGEDPHRARATYAVYLLGNGISVLYGGLGAMVFKWIRHGEFLVSLSAVGSLVFLNFLLYRYVRSHSRSTEEADSGNQVAS